MNKEAALVKSITFFVDFVDVNDIYRLSPEVFCKINVLFINKRYQMHFFQIRPLMFIDLAFFENAYY